MLKEDSGPAWLEGMGLPHFWVDVHGEAGGSLAALAIDEGAVLTRRRTGCPGLRGAQ